jgi:hypothetical protein
MRCPACGASVESDIAALQDEIDDGAGAYCRGCIEDVSDNPQYKQLFELVEDNLSTANTVEFSKADEMDRVAFVVSCITKGSIAGGSEGFHTMFRRYALLAAEDELPDSFDACGGGDDE